MHTFGWRAMLGCVHGWYVCVVCCPLPPVAEKEELKKERVWYPNNLRLSGKDRHACSDQQLVDCCRGSLLHWGNKRLKACEQET